MSSPLVKLDSRQSIPTSILEFLFKDISLRAVMSRLACIEAASAGADGSLEDVVTVCGLGLSCV